MKETDKIKKQPLSRQIIYWMAGQAEWDDQELEDLFAKAHIYPAKDRVAFWLDMALLAAGALLLGCGIIFFFAYNWADMHHFVKLGLVAAALVAVGIFTLLQQEASFPYKIGLFLLVGLTGAFFALFGQIYQTGANAYDFFFGWTAMATIWVLISGFPALWLFYLLLINTTITLYAVQVRLWDDGSGLAFVLASSNLTCWIIWEILYDRKWPLTRARWWPRVVAFFSYGMFTGLAIVALFSELENYWLIMGLIVFLAVAVVGYFVYSGPIKDLSMLAFEGLALIVFVNAFIIKILSSSLGSDSDTFIIAFFLCSLLTIVSSIQGVKYLIQLNRTWKIERIS